MSDKIDFVLGEELPNLRNLKNMQHSCVFSRCTTWKVNADYETIEVSLDCGHKRKFLIWELEGVKLDQHRFECEECPTPPETKEKMNAFFRLVGMEEWK